MTQDERDRLARWMGWKPWDGRWMDELVRWRYADWLNPPTWEQAGMLLERLHELGWNVGIDWDRSGGCYVCLTMHKPSVIQHTSGWF